MTFPKYERLLGIFVVITILLGLIVLILAVGKDEPEVILVPVETGLYSPL